jgi:DNA-binding transcriptional LysR family regulator
MDKLRALQYFVAAAEAGSFSGAARRLDVSVPAVTKLIGALERELGVRLVDRNTQGLQLTAQGRSYLDSCSTVLTQLVDAERALGTPGHDSRRTLVVGAPGLLSRLLLVPALASFRQRHPHVHIELRSIDHLTITDAQTQGIDVLVALGWPGNVSLVQKRLAQSRLIICAAPAYWARHGMPERLADLAQHDCLLVRTPEGTLLDLWRHTRGPQTEQVAVRGWLVSDSRDYVLQAVLQGQGVGRFADVSVWPHVHAGELQPVLVDWESQDSPPFSALYRPEARNDVTVQAFIGFLADLLGSLEAACRRAIGERPATTRPAWYAKRQGRASATAKPPART